MKHAVFFLSCLLLAAPCAADIIVVDDDGWAHFNNIQAAINDSNDGDIIVVFPGTYTGQGNRDIDFLGRAVTVRSVDPNDPYIVAATVIDCNSAEAEPHRGFYFHSAEDANSAIDGLTITNGCASPGGAIYCTSNSNPAIRNCIITANTDYNPDYGAGGGAIACRYAAPTIINCTITNNRALAQGGAIYCDNAGAGPTITLCEISGNTGETSGGGIYCFYSNPVLENCTITDNNTPGDGGGIHAVAGKLTVTDCTITANTANQGGGVFCGVAAQSGAALEMAGSAVTGNTAGGDGGGVYLHYADSHIVSCVIAANASAGRGGAILNTGNLTLTNSTLSGNFADNTGSALHSETTNVELTSSVLWGNRDGIGGTESAGISGPMSHFFFSCIQDDDPDDANIPFTYPFPGPQTGNIDDDPMFVRGPNDGGDGWGDDPTTPGVDEGANDEFGDLHLRSVSPCIDAGDPNFSIFFNPQDIDGQPRLIALRVDMGADEYTPSITTTRPQTSQVWAAGSLHLIEWLSYGLSGTIDIQLSDDAGGNWQIIESNLPDTGSCLLRLPSEVDSNQCLIEAGPNVPDSSVMIITSGLFTIRSYTPGPPIESKWKTLAGDFLREGLSDSNGPQFGCVKWQFDTDDAVATSVTVGLAGRVHIACEDGKLYTLDADGMLLWSYDANSPLVSSPTIGPDGTVYAGSRDGKLYAVDIDGSLRWTHTTGAPIHSSPAVSPDGNEIYVGSEDGRLYALGRDGSELWTFQTKGPGAVPLGSIFASPAIGADGTVYIGGLYDPNLYALDPNDGSIKWACSFGHPLDPSDPNSETVGGWPFASPVIAPDGTIYQTLLYDSNLYAIDSNDGSIISSISLNVFCDFVEEYFAAHGGMPSLYLIEQNCDHWFDLGFESDDERHEMYLQYKNADGWSEPALGPDGTIYVSFDDPFLRAVDPNGSIKWVTPLGDLGGFTLTVGSDALIYAAGDDGSLHVVDANGWPLAHFQTDNWLNYPVIAADNMIIVTDGKDDSLMITDPPNTVWAISQEGCRDLNFDGAIDFNDVALLAAYWLQCTDAQWPCNYQGEQKLLTADVDGDKYVKFPDLALIANLWHGCEKLLAPLPPPPPPGQASDPDPADGATDAWPSNLSWTPGSDTASYNVYFGTDNPPPFVTNQAATTFEPELLLYNTTYYWRIDSVNPEGTITGRLWTFTTRDSGGR